MTSPQIVRTAPARSANLARGSLFSTEEIFMAALKYTKPEPIYLKNHPEFNEKWLRERIIEDPRILGLGDLAVLVRERRQEKAGRIHLLLGDLEEDRRYEIEIMLGAMDESHIIRCVDYWDVERRRFPAHDHVAVLVAEDVTGRFQNVLELLSGTIPLLAIQLSALKVGDQVVLNFVRVLDQTLLRADDQTDPALASVDRGYWISKASKEVLEMIDSLIGGVNEKADAKLIPTYNRYHIGVHDGSRSLMFVSFRPLRQHLHVYAVVADTDPWVERCEAEALPAVVHRRRFRITITPEDLDRRRELITDLLLQAVREFQAWAPPRWVG
jgi:hypothetical protein